MLDCLEVAHDAIRSMGPLVRAVSRCDRDLADQLRRAAASIVSNIHEGRAFEDRRRTQHYRYAAGSANEVAAQLRIAADWGYVEAAAIVEPLALLDRVRAMLWRLTH